MLMKSLHIPSPWLVETSTLHDDKGFIVGKCKCYKLFGMTLARKEVRLSAEENKYWADI